VESLQGKLTHVPSSHEVDDAVLVAETRARKSKRPVDREFWVSLGLTASFLATACALLLTLPQGRALDPAVFLALVAAYTLACQVQFEVGAGRAVPTELVFVPMLFLLPAGAVPFCVAAGLCATALVDRARDGAPASRLLVVVGSAWHSIGPALVIGVLAAGTTPTWSDWWIYALAIAAQFAVDLASATLPDWLVLGVPPRKVLGYFVWVYLVDLALAPIGLLAAFAAHARVWPVLLTLPLIGLFAFFARERREQIDQALELSSAYRGTALLLGDVIEADDAYTGAHSQHVVALTVAVSDRLGLSARDRRLAEFTALLHDVGKVRIPSGIIGKPGPLTPEERTIMQRHTIDGERMLTKVGGLLAQVGHLVRSCHEHFGGGGYPDRLAGEAIPLIARIVSCCDAYSAMTTDRPYRAALTPAEAIRELRTCTPSQFDPQVVEALLAALALPRAA
jgi:HD-GYP domain-containing protein (c-di-GMP phosphodiesterase class II)